MLDIYIDADACPVKDEIYKVAKRYDLLVYVVSNRRMRVPFDEKVRAVVVGDAFDEADDWIAEKVGFDDIVITADIPLAARCIEAGGWVINNKGQIQDEGSIGSALAMRELMDTLRQMGEVTGGPAPMAKRDKSTFLSTLDEVINKIKNT